MSRKTRAALVVLIGSIMLLAMGAPSTAVSKRCRPGVPVLQATSAWGGVNYHWSGTKCATSYRLEVSPAPNGHWPGGPTYSVQLGKSARSARWLAPKAPRAGDGMVAPTYGNPVYARVVARNARNHHLSGIRASRWVPQWPTAPKPTAGDPVRVGTYNVHSEPRGARAVAVARNIGSHGLTVVTLQEAQQGAGTAKDVVRALNRYYGSHWDYARTEVGIGNYNNTEKEIIYRTDLLQLDDAQLYMVYDHTHPIVQTQIYSLYVSFRPVRRDGTLGGLFYVTPQHFTGTASGSWTQDAWTGTDARLLIDRLQEIAGSAPVIVAGDLRYTLEPWGERSGYVPGQPTFVRAGYYDAIASQSRTNAAYSTVNGHNGTPSGTQRPYPTGAGPRADYILVKGIRGSTRYVNVVNWSYKGLVPSDHNLVYADIYIPRS